MPVSYLTGSTLADGTEQTIATLLDDGGYQLRIDMVNATALDVVLVVRAKVQVSTGAIQLIELGTFTGGAEVNVETLRTDNVNTLEYSIEQTRGSFVTFPWEILREASTQSVLDAVNAIGSGTGGALPFPMIVDNTVSPILGVPFVGIVAEGSIDDTRAPDLSYFRINDDSNVIDIVFSLNVLGFRTATTCVFTGFLNGGNDFMEVMAYDWLAADWVRIGLLDGVSGTSNTTQDFPMFQQYTGSGVDAGQVHIRLRTTGSPSNPDVNIDSMIVEALNTSISTGYQNGAVWINTDGGSPGSQPGTNGTADNPVDNLPDAIVLAAFLGLTRFEVVANSEITFNEAHDNEVWNGVNWTLNCNGQSGSNIVIRGATNLEGLLVAAERPSIGNCGIGNAQLPPTFFNSCGFFGLFQVAVPGDFDFVACEAFNTGVDSPSFDLGAGFSGTEMTFTGWSGDVEFINISAEDSVPDEIALQGIGGRIDFDGSGGSIAIRGIYERIVDNSAEAVLSIQTGVLNRTGIQGYDNGLVYIDTTQSNTSTIPYVDGTADRAVSTLVAGRSISDKVSVRGFRLKEGSSIVLDQNYDDFPFYGPGGTVDLNDQSVLGARFEQVTTIGGSAAGTGLTVCRDQLLINTTFRNQFAGLGVRYVGTITLAAPVVFPSTDASFDESAIFVFADAAAELEINSFTDSFALSSMNSGNRARVFGNGTITINADCVGGTLEYAGDITIIDNSGGNVTLIPGQVANIREDTSVTLPNLINDVTIQRNTAGQTFHVLMVQTDGKTPAPGLTLAGQRLLDNGTYQSVSGSFVEVGFGMYRFLPSQADTNGALVSWRFSAVGADDRSVTFFTIP